VNIAIWKSCNLKSSLWAYLGSLPWSPAPDPWPGEKQCSKPLSKMVWPEIVRARIMIMVVEQDDNGDWPSNSLLCNHWASLHDSGWPQSFLWASSQDVCQPSVGQVFLIVLRSCLHGVTTRLFKLGWSSWHWIFQVWARVSLLFHTCFFSNISLRFVLSSTSEEGHNFIVMHATAEMRQRIWIRELFPGDTRI